MGSDGFDEEQVPRWASTKDKEKTITDNDENDENDKTTRARVNHATRLGFKRGRLKLRRGVCNAMGTTMHDDQVYS